MRCRSSAWAWLPLAGVLAGCGSSAPTGAVQRALPAPRVKQVDTGAMAIDRIFTSMMGPWTTVGVDVSDVGWITAFRTDVVDEGSGAPLGDEFLCHAQLEVDGGRRLAVTATGTEELRFPPGFGIHVADVLRGVPPPARRIDLFGMLLNNNSPEMRRQARVRARIEYLTEEDAGSPPLLRPLYSQDVMLVVEDSANAPAGAPAIGADGVAAHCASVDGTPGHWLVPPGPQKTRMRYPNLVPVDSTVHFAAAHLHNHGEYLRLSDTVTGEVLWQTDVEYQPERRQIARIPHYSSSEGFLLHADRVYEIEALYDNTSDQVVDAMAMLYLYFTPASGEPLYLVGHE